MFPGLSAAPSNLESLIGEFSAAKTRACGLVSGRDFPISVLPVDCGRETGSRCAETGSQYRRLAAPSRRSRCDRVPWSNGGLSRFELGQRAPHLSVGQGAFCGKGPLTWLCDILVAADVIEQRVG